MNIVFVSEIVFGALVLVGWLMNYLLSRELSKLAAALLEIAKRSH